MKRIILILSVIFSISCKKEGPQGPPGPQGPQGTPGKDLVLPKEGYIRGYVSGKDENAKPFRISYNYEYYSSLASAEALDANRIRFRLGREDSTGTGEVSLYFTWNKNTSAITDSSIEGTIAALQSSGIWLVYDIRFLNPIPLTSLNGTPLKVSNVQYQNGRLKGSFVHIHPTYNVSIPGTSLKNTHPDTLRGEFDVKVIEIQTVSRQAQENPQTLKAASVGN
ncbi:MAG: hypothetical protein ACUVRD_02650 [Bacteroidia bacterium]